VATLDAYVSYDPMSLFSLLNYLAEGVDVVNGSPYAKRGRVENVSWRRVLLSKIANRLYALVLGSRLTSLTGICRVYRLFCLSDLKFSHGGFASQAEVLGKLILSEKRISKVPVTLSGRITGHSKFKFKVVFDHVLLMLEFLSVQLTHGIRHTFEQ